MEKLWDPESYTSYLPFSFPCTYIKSLVSELKERECGVVCGEIMVPGLLFADDTVLLAESADDMRKSLQCLQRWCEKWSVEINVKKI